MTILYHAEPTLYSLKPLIVLEELGVDYERRQIAAEPVETAVPALVGRIDQQIRIEGDGPVLIDNGQMFTSSFFILEYLAQAYPQGRLAPADPYQYYRAQAIGQLVAGMIAPFVSALAVATHRPPAPQKPVPGPAERQMAWDQASRGDGDTAQYITRLEPTLPKVAAMLGTQNWFLGDYSIADIDVFAMIRDLPGLAPGLLERTAPALSDFCARMEERPAVQRALGHGWGTQTPYLPGPEISRWG